MRTSSRTLVGSRQWPVYRPGRAVVGWALAFAMMLVAGASAETGTSSGRQPPSALGARPDASVATVIEVPPLLLGAPGSNLALAVVLPDESRVPARSYLRIRGLPPQVAPNAGHALGPGAWSVPLTALRDLRLTIPADASGKSDIQIALVSIDRGVLAEARTMLVVAAAAVESATSGEVRTSTQPPLPPPARSPTTPPPVYTAPPASATVTLPEARPAAAAALALTTPLMAAPARDTAQNSTSTPPLDMPPVRSAAIPPLAKPADVPLDTPPAPPAVAPARPTLSPADRREAEQLLSRGRAKLGEGDVASARLFFRRAAEAGLAEAAIAMGGTFDPFELNRLRVVSIAPDRAEARRWYERARTLGAGAAADALIERTGQR